MWRQIRQYIGIGSQKAVRWYRRHLFLSVASGWLERNTKGGYSDIVASLIRLQEKPFRSVGLEVFFVLAIDCIHEMDNKTIKYYFDTINDLTNNFYFSVWNKTTVPHSKTLFNSGQRLDFNKNDYNVPNNWKCIFKENLIFPSNFLSLGYKIS